MNPHVKGYFLNEREGDGYNWLEDHVKRGFKLFGRTWFKCIEKQIYRFVLDKRTPVTFVQDNGDQIMPCLPGEWFISDLGSIPSLVQRYIRKEGVEYAFHDRVYEVGYLWVKLYGEHVWRAVAVSRQDGDSLLRTMGQCTREPHGKGKTTAIWLGVSVGGIFCGYTPAKLPLPDPVACRPVRTVSDIQEKQH